MEVVVFGVENSRGDYIGSIVPRDEGDQFFIIYPYLLLAHEPTLVEGLVWGPKNEIVVVYDATKLQLAATRCRAELFRPEDGNERRFLVAPKLCLTKFLSRFQRKGDE